MNAVNQPIAVTATPHRSAVISGRSDQKLFIAVRASAPYTTTSPGVSSTVVLVDISGSMNGPGGLGRSKLELVRDGLCSLVDVGVLSDQDRVGIVTFDLGGNVLRELAPIADSQRFRLEVGALDIGQGTTYLLDALMVARRMLSGSSGPRQVIILSDGEVFDAEACERELDWFVEQAVPVTAIGIGSDWNQPFMTKLADVTHGQLLHLVDDDAVPTPTSVRLSDLAGTMSKELSRGRRRTAEDVQLTLKVPGGAIVTQVHKVFPSVVALPVDQVVRCGSLGSGESIVVLIDVACPPRPDGSFRMLQVQPSLRMNDGHRLQLDPIDVVVDSCADADRASIVDGEVSNWLQQRNIAGLLTKASDATVSVEDRRVALVRAQGLATQVANVDLGKTIQVAIGDLDRSKTVRVDIAKALHVAGKTHILDFSRATEFGPDMESMIRSMTQPSGEPS